MWILKHLLLASQGSNNWKKEHIATIINNNQYSEGNSSLTGPVANHGVMGEFFIPNFAFVRIKCDILSYGATILIRLENGTEIITAHSGYGYQHHSGDIITMLPQGTYKLVLYMDADNEYGSVVSYQKYTIDALLPKFDL